MDRKLIQAYDKMTMPDRCAQRIETRLQQGISHKKQRKGSFVVLGQSRKSQTWGLAASLVCLALVVSVGGVMLWLMLQGQWQMKPSDISFDQPPAVTEVEPIPESIPREVIYGVPYTEEELQFLKQMCHVMPAWDGYATVDDVFWTEFVVRLMNEWEYALEGDDVSTQVMTPAGQGMLIRQENKVYMTREAIDEFVRETMGCELPYFVPSGEFADMISFGAEIFSVNVTEIDRYQYKLQFWDKGAERSSVCFGIYADLEQPPVGQVEFTLWQEENDRGFIIVGRPTEFRMARMENPEIEKVALEFAESHFANDVEGMKKHLSSREDSSLILNPYVQNSRAEGLKANILGVRIFSGAVGSRQPVAFVDYTLVPQRENPDYSVILYLAETEEGWKVRSWTEGNPESYDPDRELIYEVAVNFTHAYLGSNRKRMQEYMTGSSSTPPVYEGEVVVKDHVAYYPTIEKIEISFDPLEKNEAGESIADVFVGMQPLDGGNPLALYLNFVKQNDTWKVERIGEG